MQLQKGIGLLRTFSATFSGAFSSCQESALTNLTSCKSQQQSYFTKESFGKMNVPEKLFFHTMNCLELVVLCVPVR